MTSNLPAWTALDSGALPLPSAAPGGAGAVTAIVATAGAVEAGWASGGAVALAHAWATAGHRVVLTDADMLVPTLHAELGLPNQEGLSDVLLWGASVRRVAQAVEDAGFYLMSAGTVVADGTEPFEASRWAHLCDGFREAGVVLAVFAPEGSVSIGPVLAQASEVVLLAEASEDLGQLAATIRLPVRGVVGRGDTEAEEPERDAPTPMEAGGGTGDVAMAVEPEVPAAADAGALESPDVLTAESEGSAPDEPLPRASEASDAIEGGAETEETGSERFGEVIDGTEAVDGRDATRLAEPAPAAAPRDSVQATITGRERVRKKAVPPRPRRPRRGRVLVVALIAVLLGVVAAALLGFIRIPGIPPLFGAPAHSEAERGATTADSSAASVAENPSETSSVAPPSTEMTPATAPVEVTPTARFDIALAAYKSANTASALEARLGRSLPRTVVSSVPVEVNGTVFYRVLVGAAADSAGAVALEGRIAKATGLSPASWVIRSTPLAFSFGEVADQTTAASRVAELVGLDLPAYALAVDYSDGSVRYRVYVGAFADRAEASYMSVRLKGLGLDSATLSDRFGRLPE